MFNWRFNFPAHLQGWAPCSLTNLFVVKLCAIVDTLMARFLNASLASCKYQPTSWVYQMIKDIFHKFTSRSFQNWCVVLFFSKNCALLNFTMIWSSHRLEYVYTFFVLFTWSIFRNNPLQGQIVLPEGDLQGFKSQYTKSACNIFWYSTVGSVIENNG